MTVGQKPLVTNGRGNATVSVVIPCFNSHALIVRTVQSVREQTHAVHEIIVVDDGSTNPETIAALDALGPDVHLLRQENRGLPAARNAGIAATTGEFVLPLDSDDWLGSEAIERLVEALAADPEAVFAFADMTMEGELEGVLAKHFNYFEQLFFNQLPYCLMYRKRTWEALGGYDASMRQGYEDWDYNIRLGRIGPGVRVPEPLFHYRIAAGGMLLAISNRRHIELWNSIRSKNRDLYRLRSLFGLWRYWRRMPSTYPLWTYFIWAGMVAVLPLNLSNKVFSTLRKYSQSRRTGKPAQVAAATTR